jgi:hypothetical protein
VNIHKNWDVLVKDTAESKEIGKRKQIQGTKYPYLEDIILMVLPCLCEGYLPFLPILGLVFITSPL